MPATGQPDNIVLRSQSNATRENSKVILGSSKGELIIMVGNNLRESST